MIIMIINSSRGITYSLYYKKGKGNFKQSITLSSNQDYQIKGNRVVSFLIDK
jgi:hypothetical protein